MDPMIWGPSMWVALHFITMAYPDHPSPEDIEVHARFLRTLPDVLPCQICRHHFREHLRTVNLKEALSSKQKYMELLFTIHNQVNQSNGKRAMHFNDFLREYQSIIDSGHFNPMTLQRKCNMYRNSLIGVTLLFTMILVWMTVIRSRK